MELPFRELKSPFRLDDINTTMAYIIEALVIIAAISPVISREIVDELHKLDAERTDAADADCDESASRLPRRRGSLAVGRYAHLIQLYLSVKLSYKLPNLDDLLL